MAWQPIETAPKDGTAVDLWVVFPDGGMRWAGATWDATVGHWRHGQYHIGQYSDGPVATHWMPPPGPPEGQP